MVVQPQRLQSEIMQKHEILLRELDKDALFYGVEQFSKVLKVDYGAQCIVYDSMFRIFNLYQRAEDRGVRALPAQNIRQVLGIDSRPKIAPLLVDIIELLASYGFFGSSKNQHENGEFYTVNPQKWKNLADFGRYRKQEDVKRLEQRMRTPAPETSRETMGASN